MNAYLIPGVTGLLLGLTLHWAGFSRPGALQDALALRRSFGLRSGLYALGFSMTLTALLCWLAVIDVDGITVLPLSAGVLAGGAFFGIAAGLCGFTPVTAFAGVGGGPALEALSAIAGCLLMAVLLPLLNEPLSHLQAVPPLSATTLFQVTLDEPYLLGGGFLGQGCAGLLLMAIAVCVPSPRMKEEAEPDEVLLPDPSAVDAEASEPEVLLLPAAAPEETFVALLPGEEPLVVDTQIDEAAEPTPEPQEEPDPASTEADAPTNSDKAEDEPEAAAEDGESATDWQPEDPQRETAASCTHGEKTV